MVFSCQLSLSLHCLYLCWFVHRWQGEWLGKHEASRKKLSADNDLAYFVILCRLLLNTLLSLIVSGWIFSKTWPKICEFFNFDNVLYFIEYNVHTSIVRTWISQWFFTKKLFLFFNNNFKRINHCKFIHRKDYLKPFLSYLPCIVRREYFSIIFNVKKCALYSIKYGIFWIVKTCWRIFVQMTYPDSSF